jgi:signal transduction histidine kinase
MNTTESSPPGTVNILIVDDEPRNLAVLESILDDPGYRLVRASSGDEALLALVADEFAALVLDVQMPGMNGFELAQLVKERRKTARVPIIFLTAYYNEDQHILEGYGSGAVDYLHKPVNPAVLRSKVAVFAELHRKNREVERTNRLLLAEVAERRRAEARLSELNASLDERVRERTRELEDSEARLLDANRRKDEFLAILAHELRNPLAPVRNAIHFLKLRGPATADVQWASDIIDRQVGAMSRLIEDLMDVSRINQGRIELRRGLVTLESVLADALETIQPQIDGSGHKLTVLQPPAKLMVHADRARLGQVFMNILSNAAKYTDPGGQIEVRVVSEAGYAIVSIRDDGIGIQPQRLERVFELFSQEESALSRARGGLGVGLSLTRKLVQMHGGTIVASSEGQGRGSQFTIRLPLAEAVAQDAAGTAAPAVPASAPGSLRILVADDNRDAADTLAVLLQVMGHEVRQVHDGEAAVAETPGFDPQLVLLDIGMPGLNGYDACRQLRQQAGGGGRTLVAVTGWGQPQDVQMANEAGFDHHLVKPVEMQELVRLIAVRAAESRS